MSRRILPAMLLAAACAKEVAVHVRGGDRPPDPDFLFVANRAAPLDVSGGVAVDRFRLVLRNLRLQTEPTDGVNDTPGVELLGPDVYLVDLGPSALGNGAFTELIRNFPIDAKGFHEMDLDLSPVTESDVRAKEELRPLLGKTFLIEGRNGQGTAFVFESTAARVLLRESVFRMGLNHNNLDVNVAPNTWFRGPGGEPLDPASADPAVRRQIEENVAASIDAYEDDDMDGIPDPLG